MFGEIQPPMQGRKERRRLTGEKRERVIVEMEVQEVEFLVVTFPPHALEHQHMERVGIADRAMEPKRLWPTRLEFGGVAGIAAGEQCDLVAQRDQFLGQPINHTLGSTIQPGRNSIRQWSNLR